MLCVGEIADIAVSLLVLLPAYRHRVFPPLTWRNLRTEIISAQKSIASINLYKEL